MEHEKIVIDLKNNLMSMKFDAIYSNNVNCNFFQLRKCMNFNLSSN